MSPEERARGTMEAVWEAWGEMPASGIEALIADAIRAAENEALRRAARAVNETEGDPDLVILSLLHPETKGGTP